jgi:hypothetical protein
VRFNNFKGQLISFLIAAGTQGKREAEITHRFKYLPKEDVIMELEELWEEEKVQRFTIDPKRTIWRATDKINV